MKFARGLGLNLWSLLLISQNVQAQQVAPDGTLNTIVTRSGNQFTITNGTATGTNLFHSFREFSIPTGGAALFNNAPTVQNIFSRVTGGTVSSIDGLIQTNGANLFLLNPSGILFGPNARLNVGGSFIGTSADSIKFGDGVEFSAVNLATTPLLTMSVPIGLQLGQNPGAIRVQGVGSNLSLPAGTSSFNPSPVLGAGRSTTGLRVQPGKTLALVGNGIAVEGGSLSAPQGRIELGSGVDGTIGLTPDSKGWNLGYSGIQNFRDIQLSQKAAIDASGIGNGAIHLQGRKIAISDGSTVLIQNQGAPASGTITVSAATDLEISGSSAEGRIASRVQSETVRSGNAAPISISANRLLLQEGGGVTSTSFSSGAAGNITVNAAELIQMVGESPVIRSASRVSTSSYRSGRAGDITLNSGRSILMDRGIALTTTYQTGRAGDIRVTTEQLKLTQGGLVSSATYGAGLAGDLTVNASESIEAIGEHPVSNLFSGFTSGAISSGSAGALSINTRRLILRDGGRVDSSTLSSGVARSVTVNATDFVEISGIGAGSKTPSQIISSADIIDPVLQKLYNLPSALPSGNSGDVIVNTSILRITDGGRLNVQNKGTGNAGTVRVTAEAISLDRKGSITASTESGEGGNIFVRGRSLVLRDNSSMVATAKGTTGNGGNVTIQAPVMVGLGNSDISANAVVGNGGEVQITTQGIFGLTYRRALTDGNDITASSNSGTSGTVQITNISLDPNSGLIQLPKNTVDASQQVAAGCTTNPGSSFVITGRGGLPHNPAEQSRVTSSWIDLRALESTQQLTSGSAMSPLRNSKGTAVLAVEPLIEATTWQRNPQTGKVELIAGRTTQSKAIATCAIH